MKLRRVGWTTFRLPLRAAFATAHGTLDAREGIIIRLVADEGWVGLGEASPVPGFAGSQIELVAAFGALAPRLVGRDLAEVDAAVAGLDLTVPTNAAIGFALDTAVWDLRGQEAGLSISRMFQGDAGRPIPVHATIGSPSTAEAIVAARTAVDAGYRCIKLKVGGSRSETAEITRIAAVRDAIGACVRLRLDANEAWSVSEAVAIIRHAERFDVDLVEQPVHRADLPGLAQVRRSVRTPIAADEAASDLSRTRRIIALGAADVLVVKPMLTGGLRTARMILDEASRAGVQAFVTTTLDSGIGVAAAVQLAATLPSPLLPCGLATRMLLAEDLIATPLAVADGTIRVPAGSGLGVTLDDGAARRWGGPWQEVEP